MGEVVEDEGITVREESVDSISQCEKLCDESDACNSFKYCKNDPKNRCFLNDKVLTGNEPTIFVKDCTSYYTAGE